MEKSKVRSSRVSLEFSYNKDEYIKSRRKFLRINKSISTSNIIFLLVMTLLEIIFLVIHEFFFGIIIGMLLIISYIMIGALYFILPKKIYEKNDYLKEKMQVEIYDDGIKIKRKNIDSFIEWKQIPSIDESKDFLFFVQDKMNYILIPKRVIKNNYDLVTIQKIYKAANLEGIYKNIK